MKMAQQIRLQPLEQLVGVLIKVRLNLVRALIKVWLNRRLGREGHGLGEQRHHRPNHHLDRKAGNRFNFRLRAKRNRLPKTMRHFSESQGLDCRICAVFAEQR